MKPAKKSIESFTTGLFAANIHFAGKLTSSAAFPMNFPLFHHVIVAGGLEPELRHSKIAGLETENGSGGEEMVTV